MERLGALDMKAITLWQPWASLWLTTAKVHETRPWQTHYRGELAVHAARRPVAWHLPDGLHALCIDYLGPHYVETLPRGAIIGVIQLIDCYSSNDHGPVDRQDRICGNFSDNRYLWKRGQFVKLAKPLAAKGRQGLWNGPEHILGASHV